MTAAAGRLSSYLIAPATMLLIVAAAVVPFLSPQWVAFEQDRANATGWTGYTMDELRTATDAILSDLVFGPPAFDVEVGGEPVLVERERGHMRDVRSVFVGLWAAAAASIVVLIGAAVLGERPVVWRLVRRGAILLTGLIVALGIVALIAFDRLFELFHVLFFPAGSYTFDPASERLVQLFPFQFWQETAVVVGIVIVALSLGIGAIAKRREASSSGHAPAPGLAPTPEPSR